MEAAKEHKTEVGTPVVFPVENEFGYTWIAAGIAIVTAIFALRRRLSRDNTEMTKDRAETNLVVTLTKERDTAMRAAEEAWATKTEDAAKIATLEQEVIHLNDRIERLEDQLNRVIKMFVPPDVAELLQIDVKPEDS